MSHKRLSLLAVIFKFRKSFQNCLLLSTGYQESFIDLGIPFVDLISQFYTIVSLFIDGLDVLDDHSVE